MMNTKYTGLEIAVIGMAGKFPGAGNVEVFWENIKNGKETIQDIPEEELTRNGVTKDELDHPLFVRKSAPLEGKDQFDSNFFGMTPAEAEVMDPQLRQLHQCVWHAIEDSGNHARMKEVATAIFMGASHNFEWEAYSRYLRDNQEVDSFRSSFLVQTKFISTSLAYHFGLKGPALYLDTACSTSLMAVHMACRSLITGEAKMALAGGVSIRTNKRRGQFYNENGIVSKDGRCMSFHKGNSGTIGGEGVGVVVLKKLQDAITDGDEIHAIIKGSAANNDGKRKVGYTAPSVDGQSECIRLAQKNARVKPETIGYIEGHGSATQLGDPVEVSALKSVFGEIPGFSAQLGSIKSNIGHLDAAAGIAGLIKGIVILKNKTIPKAVHSESPIDDLTWHNGAFLLNKEPMHWEENDAFPRRVGVSSSGIGGTNVHVILEEAPGKTERALSSGEHILTVSAKSENSASKYVQELSAFVRNNEALNLRDFCFSSNTIRPAYNYKMAITFSDEEELLLKLGKAKIKRSVAHSGEVIFIFSGQTGFNDGVCRELYEGDQRFRNFFDKCASTINEITGINATEALLNSTRLVDETTDQLLLASIQYSISQWLMELGIRPKAMIGYSFGEYITACVSGVMDFATVVRIISGRALLMSKLEKGAMLGVPLKKEELEAYMGAGVSIAIDNGDSCVVAGTVSEVEQFELLMKEKRQMCTRLNIPRAMHSRIMEPIRVDFEAFLADFELNKPQIPYVSNVTGDWISEEQATDTGYWSTSLCQMVEFHKGINVLMEDENNIYVEIGIGKDIRPIVLRELEKRGRSEKVFTIIRPVANPLTEMKYAKFQLGKLWEAGVSIEWGAFYADQDVKRMSVPLYSFEKRSFPTEIDLFGEKTQKLLSSNTLQSADNPYNWIYKPVWEQKYLDAQKAETQNELVVAFIPEGEKGAKLSEALSTIKNKLIKVYGGHEYNEKSGVVTIRTEVGEDMKKFFKTQGNDSSSIHIVYGWNIGMDSSAVVLDKKDTRLQMAFYQLAEVIKATIPLSKAVRLSLITDEFHSIFGTESGNDAASLSLGIMNVISQELGIKGQNIDLDLTAASVPELQKALAHELNAAPEDRMVAYRNGKRWVRKYQQHRTEIKAEPSKLKKNGIYLITGGWGNIGKVLAKYLMSEYEAHVILLGRKELNDTIRSGMEVLRQSGGEISYYTSDVTVLESFSETIKLINEKYRIDGLIHAAGLTSLKFFELVEELTYEKSSQVLAPKLTGIQNIHEVFGSKELDFAWFTSSLVTVMGGPTNAAYAAANLFMEYFIQSKQEKLPSWTCMSFGTMLIDPEAEENDNEAYTSIVDWTLSQEDQASFIIAKFDLNEGIRKMYFEQPENQINVEQIDANALFMERPDLSTDYVEPQTETERELVALIEMLFNIRGVGIYDDFFEMGGDSLKAIFLLRRIKEEFGVSVSLTEFMDHGNLKTVAQEIDDTKLVSEKTERETKMII